MAAFAPPAIVAKAGAKMAVKFAKPIFKLKQTSPKWLLGGGIALIGFGFVYGCVQSTKLAEYALDPSAENLERLNDEHRALQKQLEDLDTRQKNVGIDQDGELVYVEEYTPEEWDRIFAKRIRSIHFETVGKIFKLYWLPVAAVSGGIAMVCVSNGILNKRFLQALAAYDALDATLRGYRDRVRDHVGPEIEDALYNNYKLEKKEVVDPETGEKKEVTTIEKPGSQQPSIYAKWFDESCEEWTKDAAWNLSYLHQQQSWFNSLLYVRYKEDERRHPGHGRGHVFLNEVYDGLDIERTPEGAICGWIYDERNPNGDNFIDFGLYDLDNERKRAFVNGYEPTILLDFNVDGKIFDKI